MVLPAILTLLFFSLYPLLYSLALSLSDSQLARPFRAFVAFKNYSDAIADSLFRSSIELTFIYAFGVTLIETAIGFGLALLLNQESALRVLRARSACCRLSRRPLPSLPSGDSFMTHRQDCSITI